MNDELHEEAVRRTDALTADEEVFESYGTVKLMDWWPCPGGQAIHIRGQIRIVSDEDTVGFRARGANSANWLAVITGESAAERRGDAALERWHIFGCQIRAIIEHGPELEFPDSYTVR